MLKQNGASKVYLILKMLTNNQEISKNDSYVKNISKPRIK